MKYSEFALLTIILLVVLLVPEGVKACLPDGAAQEIRLFKISQNAEMNSVTFRTHFMKQNRSLLCPDVEHISSDIHTTTRKLHAYLKTFFSVVQAPLHAWTVVEILQDPMMFLGTIAPQLQVLIKTQYAAVYSQKLVMQLNPITHIYLQWREWVKVFFKSHETEWDYAPLESTQHLAPDYEVSVGNWNVSITWPMLSTLISMEVMLKYKVTEYTRFKALVQHANAMVPYLMAHVFENQHQRYCSKYFKDQMHWEQRDPQMSLRDGNMNGEAPSQGKMVLMLKATSDKLECSIFNFKAPSEDVAFSIHSLDNYLKNDSLYLYRQYSNLNTDLASIVEKFNHSVYTNPSFTRSKEILARYSHYQRGDVNGDRYISYDYVDKLISPLRSHPSLESLYTYLSERYQVFLNMYKSTPSAIENFLDRLENQKTHHSLDSSDTGLDITLLPNKVVVIEFKRVFDYTLMNRLVFQASRNYAYVLPSLLETLKLQEQYAKQLAKRMVYRSWFYRCKDHFELPSLEPHDKEGRKGKKRKFTD